MFGISLHITGNVRVEHVQRHCSPLAYRLGPFTEEKGLPIAMPQSVTITDSQQFVISAVTAKDHRGNAIPLAAPATFESSDTTVATVTDNGDGTATVAAVGIVGAATITISADGLTDTIDVSVTLGTAATLSETIGAPTDIPTPAPVPAGP